MSRSARWSLLFSKRNALQSSAHSGASQSGGCPMSLLSTLLMASVIAVACRCADAADDPASPKRPNVLFIVADDLNDHVGAYGRPVKTPNIDRLANRGIRFNAAYCQNPVCYASRASFLSGRRPATTKVDDMNTPPRVAVGNVAFLPEHFHAHGYRTARVGKISHNTQEASVTWDVSESTALFSPGTLEYFDSLWEGGENETWKRDRVFGQLFANQIQSALKNRNQLPARDPRVIPATWPPQQLFWFAATWHAQALDDGGENEPDAVGARRIVELLEQQGNAPFFIGAGFYRPHLPWVAPKKYFDLYPLDKIELPNDPIHDRDDIPKVALSPLGLLESNPQTDEQARRAIQAYYASVTFLDEQVGLVLNALDRLGLADNTIVVLTSDHGYHLGEHRGLWHKLSLFEESAKVPLIVAVPGRTSGKTSDLLVELVDLYPTLSELAGLEVPEGLEGTSFAPLIESPNRPWKSAAFSEVALPAGIRGHSICTETYRYTEWGKDAELYDHRTDPHEWTNIARDPNHAELLEQAKASLQGNWQKALPVASTAGVTKAEPQ
jgi:iduronate 2-sulfatase